MEDQLVAAHLRERFIQRLPRSRGQNDIRKRPMRRDRLDSAPTAYAAGKQIS
jgi:hypothetical protein